MADRQLLRLNDNWALAYDENQWIIQRRKMRRDESYWNPVSYIGEKKSTLMCRLREKGVVIDPEAQFYLDQMPDTFLQWLRTSDAEMERLVEQVREAAE